MCAWFVQVPVCVSDVEQASIVCLFVQSCASVFVCIYAMCSFFAILVIVCLFVYSMPAFFYFLLCVRQ